MKNNARKFLAVLLATAMTATTFSPTALAAAPKVTKSAASKTTTTAVAKDAKSSQVSSTIDLNTAGLNNTEAFFKAAKALGKAKESAEDTKKVNKTAKEEKAEAAVQDAILTNDEVDLTGKKISSDTMDTATENVLEQNNMTKMVDVTYKTDDSDHVTTVNVEMDSQLALAAEEIQTQATGMTEDEKEKLLGEYSNYLAYFAQNADYFGVQTAYFTTKDTNNNPIGSLLSIAIQDGETYPLSALDYQTASGIVSMFTMANQFAVNLHGQDLLDARDSALKSIENCQTTQEKLLALNDWLANWATFDMAYIMKMDAPEPKVDADYNTLYNALYDNIKQQVYDGYYNNMKDTYGEDAAKQVATAQSEAYMEDPAEEGASNGKESAQTLAASILNLWEGNQFGVLVKKTGVCLGYSNAYVYLVQCAFPDVYKKDGQWRTYEDLNYEKDDDGNVKKDSDGNPVWSKDADAMVDYVRITFDTDVTMYGVTQENFNSDHYWNAVKVDGQWYYVDPCYTDIYIECMIRERVETDGNMNHMYFMVSDTSIRKLYDGYFKTLKTLYEGIATDKTYETAWFAFAKSPVFEYNGDYYYYYDSTDLINQMSQTGGMGQSTNSLESNGATKAADNDFNFGQSESDYKLVAHKAGSTSTEKTDFTTLVDFNNGTYYDKNAETDDKMVKSSLITGLMDRYEEYSKAYPSLSIGAAMYNGIFYFSIADSILSYNVETCELKTLIRYTEISGQRDLSVALGGMAFTATKDSSKADVTLKGNPIADMTIKDGKMYVSIGTNLGFISGKDTHDVNMNDGSSNGYAFEETNYNTSYQMAKYGYGSETNDNDEFMWSANIVDTIDMAHLTGTSHSYADVQIDASCTEDAYTVNRCSTCGLISETAANSLEASGEVKNAEESNATESEKDTASASETDPTSATDPSQDPSQSPAESESPSTTETPSESTTEAPTQPTTNDVTLTVKLVDEAGDAVGDAVTIKHEQVNASEDTTFTAEEITKAITVPDGYRLGTVEDVTVKAGETAAETTVTVQKADAVATLNITVKEKDAADDADPLATTTLTKKDGVKGEEATFSAAEIQEAVEAALTGLEKDYQVTEEYADQTVKYGESADLALTAEVVLHGHGHRYIKFDETYYTKADGSDSWNTGSAYVCIDCKKAVDTDEISSEKTGKDTVIEDLSTLVTDSTKKDLWLWGDDIIDTKVNESTTVRTYSRAASLYVVPTQADTSLMNLDCFWDNKNFVTRERATVEKVSELSCTDSNGPGFSYKATAAGGSTSENSVKSVAGHNYDGEKLAVDVGHDYSGEPSAWSWAMDNSYAVASFTCKNSSEHTKKLRASVEQTGENQPTCEQGGTTTYTATVTGPDGQTYTTSKEEQSAALGHSYKTPEFKWSDDYKTCEATFVCEREGCGHEETVTCEVSKVDDESVAAACETDGKNVYEAKAVVDNKTYTDKETEVLKALGHDFDASGKCTRCGATRGETTVTIKDSTVNYTGKPIEAKAEVTGSKADPVYTYFVDQDATKKTTADNSGAAKEGAAPVKPGVYYVKAAVAEDNFGSAAESNVAKLTIRPRQVTMKAASNSSSGITVTWNKLAEAQSYRVYRRAEGTSSWGSALKTINGNSKVSYSDTKAKAGVTYSYTVVAVANGVKATYDKNGVSVKRLTQPDLKVANAAAGVTIKWNKATGADGYYVYRKAGSTTKWSKIATVKKGSTVSYTDKTAKSGTTYKYTVKAYSGKSVGSYNSGKSVKYLAQPSVSTANGSAGVTVKWSKTAGAQGYYVYRKAGSATKWSKIATIKKNSTVSYTDKKATSNGTKYVYTVKAYSGKTYSSYTSGTTIYRLNRSGITSLKNSSAKKMTVKWAKNSKANGYQVQYATNSKFSKASTSTVTSKNTVSRTISKLSKGKTYYVRVRSYKKVSGKTYYSGWCTVKKVKITK